MGWSKCCHALYHIEGRATYHYICEACKKPCDTEPIIRYIHQEPSPLKGKTCKIREDSPEIGGREIKIEDWWDRLFGYSWTSPEGVGKPSLISYAIRTALTDIPGDDEVLYGKIKGLEFLIHESELESYVQLNPDEVDKDTIKILEIEKEEINGRENKHF